MAEFLVQYFWYIVLAVFLIGTALLLKTKFKRSFILFLIETKHGLRFLDLGKKAPNFWKALADFSIILSFGGLGAVYVSRYRNVYPFMLVFGVIALLMAIPRLGPELTGLLFLLLLASTYGLHKLNNSKAWFLLAAVIMFSTVLVFTGSTEPAALLMSTLTGIFGLPGLLFGALAQHASSILFQGSTTPGVSPLLPGISQGGELGFMFPGLNIFIPLWSGLLAIIILLVSHEFSHGFLSRACGVKVNSMGLLTFGIIPIGAFVNPDEKQLNARKSEDKMRVYSMGSFANIVVAVIAVLLTILVASSLSGMVDTAGIKVLSVQEGLPASNALESGMIITSINGVPVSTMEEYLNESLKLKPGDPVTLVTDKGTFTLTTVASPEDPGRAILGFSLSTHLALKSGMENQQAMFSFLLALSSLLSIIFLLNFNVAIINLLPIVPLDGSKMFEELLKSFKISPEKRKKIIKWIVWLFLLILLVNALPLGGLISSALGI